MHAAEVVIRKVQRNRLAVVLDLLGEPIRQAREVAHGHSHRQVLPLDVGRGNVRSSGLPLVTSLVTLVIVAGL